MNVTARALVAQAHLPQNAASGRPRAHAESRAKKITGTTPGTVTDAIQADIDKRRVAFESPSGPVGTVASSELASTMEVHDQGAVR